MSYDNKAIRCYEKNFLLTNYTYMEIYFLNPQFAIHSWSHSSIPCFKYYRFWRRSLLKEIIALFNEAPDENTSLLLLKTILFNVGHSHKSSGVKSGESGGHERLKCFPITLSRKMSDIILLVVDAAWGAAPFCIKYNQDAFRQDLSCWASQVMQSW